MSARERFPPVDVLVTALLSLVLALGWLCVELARDLSLDLSTCSCSTTDGGPRP